MILLTVPVKLPKRHIATVHTTLRSQYPMDVFATTVTSVQSIYKITIFVRGVVSEMKNYDSKNQDIQAKLEHEFLFLEEFKTIMFDNKDARFSYNALPNVHKKDFQNILGALERTLSQYGLLATKHGLDIVDGQDSMKSFGDPIPVEEIRQCSSKWRAAFKQFRAKFNKLDWALFDKDKILKLLQEYSEWTERLRQVMFMVLLVAGTLGTTDRSNLMDRRSGRSLGLHVIAKRQMKVETAIDVRPLDKDLLSDMSMAGDSKLYHLTEYQDPAGFDSIPVLLEKHFLNKNLGLDAADEAAQKDAILEPVRSLVSLLRETTSQDVGADLDPLRTLECIGYIDQRYPKYSLVVYRYRSVELKPGVRSLHDWIGEFSAAPLTKPSIGDRFFVAYSLASSVFGVHVSGWLHKGLRSKAVLLLKGRNDIRPTPHLIGWGTARRTSHAKASNRYNEPENNDLEANIYRHPDRYDLPRENYIPAHDIYSLGVVLLEIGYWKTMSERFKKPMDIARNRGELPAALLVREHLLKAARGMELKQEMGNEYSKVVERCLLTEFEVDVDDDKFTTLIRNFKELVIDRLRLGLPL